MQWKFILSLILAFFVAIFAIQNSDPVDVSFFFTSWNISQALIILISTAIGAVIALSLGLFKQLSLKKSIKEQSKKIQSLEKETSSLQAENDSLRDLNIPPKENPADISDSENGPVKTKVLDYREK